MLLLALVATAVAASEPVVDVVDVDGSTEAGFTRQHMRGRELLEPTALQPRPGPGADGALTDGQDGVFVELLNPVDASDADARPVSQPAEGVDGSEITEIGRPRPHVKDMSREELEQTLLAHFADEEARAAGRQRREASLQRLTARTEKRAEQPRRASASPEVAAWAERHKDRQGRRGRTPAVARTEQPARDGRAPSRPPRSNTTPRRTTLPRPLGREGDEADEGRQDAVVQGAVAGGTSESADQDVDPPAVARTRPGTPVRPDALDADQGVDPPAVARTRPGAPVMQEPQDADGGVPGGGPAAPGAPGTADRPDELDQAGTFDELDANGDGVINRTEALALDAWARRHAEKQRLRAKGPGATVVRSEPPEPETQTPEKELHVFCGKTMAKAQTAGSTNSDNPDEVEQSPQCSEEMAKAKTAELLKADNPDVGGIAAAFSVEACAPCLFVDNRNLYEKAREELDSVAKDMWDTGQTMNSVVSVSMQEDFEDIAETAQDFWATCLKYRVHILLILVLVVGVLSVLVGCALREPEEDREEAFRKDPSLQRIENIDSRIRAKIAICGSAKDTPARPRKPAMPKDWKLGDYYAGFVALLLAPFLLATVLVGIPAAFVPLVIAAVYARLMAKPELVLRRTGGFTRAKLVFTLLVAPYVLLLCLWCAFVFVMNFVFCVPYIVARCRFRSVAESWRAVRAQAEWRWLTADEVFAACVGSVYRQDFGEYFRNLALLPMVPVVKWVFVANPWLFQLREVHFTQWTPGLGEDLPDCDIVDGASLIVAAALHRKAARGVVQDHLYCVHYPLPAGFDREQAEDLPPTLGLHVPAGTLVRKMPLLVSPTTKWHRPYAPARSELSKWSLYEVKSSFWSPYHHLTGTCEVNLTGDHEIEHPCWVLVGQDSHLSPSMACERDYVFTFGAEQTPKQSAASEKQLMKEDERLRDALEQEDARAEAQAAEALVGMGDAWGALGADARTRPALTRQSLPEATTCDTLPADSSDSDSDSSSVSSAGEPLGVGTTPKAGNPPTRK